MDLQDNRKEIIDSHDMSYVIDKTESGRLRAYMVSKEDDKVRAYISLYYEDKTTFEVSSVVADPGMGQVIYAIAAMSLSEDDIWICPSMNGDTNSDAMRVWDKFLDDDSVKHEYYEPLEDSVVSFKFSMEPKDWFNERKVDGETLGEDALVKYAAEGQMYFDIMYRRGLSSETQASM